MWHGLWSGGLLYLDFWKAVFMELEIFVIDESFSCFVTCSSHVPFF